ncbi:MAG: hypothetical protein G01um10142_294 [Parcubacteria group bacterium Gr01-1014_2]|nr:MAG: hypothetical protein G01um10142_294 [Parcubacteria group bacterium Gr01-1014_2]
MRYTKELLGLRIRYSPEIGKAFKGQWHRRHIVHWAVNANWNDDGWNVNANSVENPNEWNQGNQVLSRYSLLSEHIVFMCSVSFV